MLQFTNELYGRLQTGIRQIQQGPGGELIKAEQTFSLCCRHLNELKGYISTYSFKDIAEEIHFFKEVKPGFLREMHFYLNMLQLESKKPLGTTEEVTGYYRSILHEMGRYIERNQTLYLYYKMEADQWDDKLFVREPEGVPLLAPDCRYNDGSHCNIYSYKIAKIQALEELVVWIQGLIRDPEAKIVPVHSAKAAAATTPIAWKGTQAQFYEFVLGAVKSGALGEVSLKVAMEWLAYCFSIRTGHFYRYIQVMRIRKKDRTPFLKKCVEAVEAYMDDCDEHPRYR